MAHIIPRTTLALPAGTRLGPYEILSPLGAGGMGEVYRARDTRLDRTVAIKVMPAHLSATRELQERFEREARTISSLHHPHICALYDVGSQDGVDFLVMEYLEGQTLADRLGTVSRTGSGMTVASSRALKLEEALTIAWQIADALDKAHRQGVVHRDLKPGNIMLTSSGAKLLDFGLAKQATPAVTTVGQSLLQTSDQPLTARGAVIGTFQYMAPEQLEGREADARTDIFAFGTVVYEMVTGRRAFDAKTQVSLIAAIVDHDPPLMSSLQPVSTSLLDHLVKTCLAKNPDKRWQSMADVALQLRAIMDRHDARESDPAPPKMVRKLRAMQLTAAALAIALASAVAIGTRWYFSEAPRPARLQFELPMPPANNLNQFAVSPDGTHIVAPANVGGRARTLWVASIEHGTGQALPDVAESQWPFWSPDGRHIGYFSDGKLKKVDLAGGAPQTISDSGTGAGGTWNQDDAIVFAPDLNNTLFRVSASAGKPTQLTTLDKQREEFSHRHPQFLPDGRHFLYVAVSRRPENSAVFVGSIDSPERTELVQSAFRAVFAPPDRLLFMRDETTLMAQSFDPSRRQLAGEPYIVAENLNSFTTNSAAAFSASSTGLLVYRRSSLTGSNTLLRWFDREGKDTPAIDGENEYANPALAPDRRHLAVARTTATLGQARATDLWLIDLERGPNTRFTFDAAQDDAAVWSPDGSSLVFTSNRGGNIFNLYRKMAAGVEPEQLLLASDHNKMPEDWSADGTMLLYRDTDPQTGPDLWVLPMTGDSVKPQPVVHSPFSDLGGRFSPDRRWIAYTSFESGRGEIFVVAFPNPSQRIQISSAGGTRPQWRGDGHEIFYVQGNPASGAMMAVDVTVAADGRLIAGLPRKLFDAPVIGPFDVTPDGKRFLINVPPQRDQSAQAPLTVVANWK